MPRVKVTVPYAAIKWYTCMYNFVKPYFKVDRNTFKGLHLIPEWNVTFFNFRLAYQYQSTFQISLNSGEAVKINKNSA